MTTGEQNEQPQRSFAISEATLVGLPGEILVRGWAANPAEIASARILYDGKVIGMTPLNSRRADVAAKFGMPEEPFHGFLYRGRVPAEAVAGEKIDVTFMSRKGKPLATETRPIAQGERLDDLEVVYDADSRQLRLSGCVFTTRQMRGLSVEFTRGNQHAIRNIFQFRPMARDLDPRKRSLYSGFHDRIPFVGEGDIREAKLEMKFTDGTTSLWAFPPDMIKMNLPEGHIESFTLNWLDNTVEAKGWFRSYAPVTELSMTINGQKMYGIPSIRGSERIQKALGFRGQMADEFKISGAIDMAFEAPEDLRRAARTSALDGTLTLRSQNAVLLDVTAPIKKVEQAWGKILLAQFDRRSSLLQFDGTLALPAAPTHAQVLINDRRVDDPLPVEATIINGEGNFSWTHEINGVIPPAGKIGLAFFDADGEEIGVLEMPATHCLTISRQGAVDGLTDEALGLHLIRAYAGYGPTKAPGVCFTLQGMITMVGSGGGIRRLADLMESFHDAGYVTTLIDRSEPWNLLKWPEEYRRLRRFCHRHIMIPQLSKRHMGQQLAKQIDEGKFVQPAGGLPKAASIAELLRKPPRREAHGLAARVDPEFNTLAAALINALRPRVAITSYAWSGPIHDLLHPSIHGMIDTIDIQSLRAEVFAKAQETFGTEAVPELEKFAASLDEELALLSKAKTLITISRSEQAFLCEHMNPSRIVHAGVSVRDGQPLPPTDPASRTVLFVGNAYEPNTDGIALFMRNVWPAVMGQVPDAHLVICGRVCSTITDPELPSVDLLGPVEDLTEQYAAAALTVNPIRFGTGTSVKLVETLAMGRTIVSTPQGARGFEDAASAGALKIADFEAQADEIGKLLLDPEYRHVTEAAATAFARQALSPEHEHSDLFNLVESMLYY